MLWEAYVVNNGTRNVGNLTITAVVNGDSAVIRRSIVAMAVRKCLIGVTHGRNMVAMKKATWIIQKLAIHLHQCLNR